MVNDINMKKKEIKYKNLTQTSCKIPMFGYKSSFFIVSGFMVVLFLVPPVFRLIGSVGNILGLIVSSILLAWIVCYAHFYIQTKQKMVRNFWLLFIFLTIVFLVILLIAYNNGLIM